MSFPWMEQVRCSKHFLMLPFVFEYGTGVPGDFRLNVRRNFFPVIWNLLLIVVSRHRVYSSSLSSMTSWPFQLPMQSIYIWCFPGGIALYLFFWVTASHSLVDGHHSIRGTHCPHFRVYFWWRAPNIIINVLPPSWNATPKSEATHVVLPTVTSQYVQNGSTDEC